MSRRGVRDYSEVCLGGLSFERGALGRCVLVLVRGVGTVEAKVETKGRSLESVDVFVVQG